MTKVLNGLFYILYLLPRRLYRVRVIGLTKGTPWRKSRAVVWALTSDGRYVGEPWEIDAQYLHETFQTLSAANAVDAEVID